MEISNGSLEFKLLQSVIKELRQSLYVEEIYVVAYNKETVTLAGGVWIDRNALVSNTEKINVEKLLSLSLKEIESRGNFPEAILYVNHNYPFRPENLFNELIAELQYMGLGAVFAGFIDYGHYWEKDIDDGYRKIDSSMDSRIDREPIMRALYGLGCATSSVEIRKGNITGGNIGIIPINNYQFTLNTREIGSQEIIEKIRNL